MNKPYLIFVNGSLAARKLTFKGARKALDELKAKGYSQVSLAEEAALESKDKGLERGL